MTEVSDSGRDKPTDDACPFGEPWPTTAREGWLVGDAERRIIEWLRDGQLSQRFRDDHDRPLGQPFSLYLADAIERGEHR